MANYCTRACADGSLMRLDRSLFIATPAAGTHSCIAIPKFAFLKDVWLWISEAGSSDTISIGLDGGGLTADTDFFMSTATVVATADGYQRATGFPGMWFNTAAGMITMTVGTTQTTGLFLVLADFAVIH